MVQTFVLVASVLKQAKNPFLGKLRVLLDALHGIVLEHENDGEENDIRDDNENDANSSPLEGDHTADTTVCLARCICADAVLIRGKTRTFGRGAVITKTRKVNLDTVAERGEGNDDGQARKDQERNPERCQTVLVIDVTRRTEAERNATEHEGQCDTDDGDAPASGLGEEHEVSSNQDLPANLQVQREGAHESPHESGKAAKEKKRAGGAAELVRSHSVGCDLIVTLVGLSYQGHNEAELKPMVSTSVLSCALVWQELTFMMKTPTVKHMLR